MRRLRLVKMQVQPVFVIDDGENLVEKPAQPLEVSAADWPLFPEQFAEQIALAEAALNEPPIDSAA